METANNTEEKILAILLKEQFATHTVTSLAKAIGITRQGIWKTLNKLVANNLIVLEAVGKTKTSTDTIKLNWNSLITERTLSLLLTKEALKQERWRDNFKKLEKHTLFTILFGSILHSPKEANDIDMLIVVKTKNDFKVIESILSEAQQVQTKKIHAIDLTERELEVELKKKNKAYLEAIKKGIILFGQEKFIKFIEDISK